MDVGNQASALHLIAYLVVDDDAPYATEPSRGWNLPPIPGARLMKDPARFRSPAAADIVSWRDRLAIRRQSQLGEILTWDETTDFCEAADAAVSGDLLLRYVAAIASDEGGAAAVRGLAGREGPPHEKIGRALVDARRRGFTGRYPQLLLGEQFWLPFERNTIIEEPDWHGKTERFGSNTRLAEEIRELKAMIEEADPHVTQWTWEAGRPEDILGAAWQAGETMVRICTAAIARHLPFWTAG